jgi:hypothetical protein
MASMEETPGVQNAQKTILVVNDDPRHVQPHLETSGKK